MRTNLGIVGLLMVSAAAQAQPAPAAGDPTMVEVGPDQKPAKAPGYVLLDRFDGQSRATFDASYLDTETGEGTILRFDVHAHYVDAASGFGGYAQVPFAV